MTEELRLFRPEDSLEELQALVHRAYSSLAEKGLNYWGTRQSLEDTERRARSGECWVLTRDDSLVATILLKPPRSETACDWYQRADVRSFHQLAVEPALQRAGLGARLVAHVESRATALGAQELALDTSEHATWLIAWYERLGYRQVDRADWRPQVNYRSVVLSKTLRPTAV